MKGKFMNKFDKNEKVILTDVDGVLLNWEWAFKGWLKEHVWFREGRELKEIVPGSYEMNERYGLTVDQGKEYVTMFNKSAAIGFLPPQRDAMYYVDLLHRKHGFTFQVITSLSKNEHACHLRTENLKKLFGETAFRGFTYLDTAADKDEALAVYKDSGLIWIEDKLMNAEAGLKVGLDCYLLEHGHNMHMTNPNIKLVKNWKDIYELIT